MNSVGGPGKIWLHSYIWVRHQTEGGCLCRIAAKLTTLELEDEDAAGRAGPVADSSAIFVVHAATEASSEESFSYTGLDAGGTCPCSEPIVGSDRAP